MKRKHIARQARRGVASSFLGIWALVGLLCLVGVECSREPPLARITTSKKQETFKAGRVDVINSWENDITVTYPGTDVPPTVVLPGEKKRVTGDLLIDGGETVELIVAADEMPGYGWIDLKLRIRVVIDGIMTVEVNNIQASGHIEGTGFELVK